MEWILGVDGEFAENVNNAYKNEMIITLNKGLFLLAILGVHAWPRSKEGLSLLRIIKIFLRIKKKNYTSVQITADPFNTIVMYSMSWSWRRGLAQSDMCPGSGGTLLYKTAVNATCVYTHV